MEERTGPGRPHLLHSTDVAGIDRLEPLRRHVLALAELEHGLLTVDDPHGPGGQVQLA